MDSKRTMLLAVLLLIAALVLGVIGYRLSQGPAEPVRIDTAPAPAPAPAAAQEPAGIPVVIAMEPLLTGMPITRDALGLARIPLPAQPEPGALAKAATDTAAAVPGLAPDPKAPQATSAGTLGAGSAGTSATAPRMPLGSFATIDEVVGKIPLADVPAGQILYQSHFELGGPLARLLKPEERALAVAVDEVVGSGGHATPGDQVDVLLFMDRKEMGAPSAQIVIKDVRLLAYGPYLIRTESKSGTTADDLEADAVPAPGDDQDQAEARKARAKARADAAKAREANRTRTRSAVLAVAEAKAPPLMLASETGSIRLAVRAKAPPVPAPPAGAAPVAADRKEDPAATALLPTKERLRVTIGELVAPSQPPRAAGRAPVDAAVTIYRGDKKEDVRVR